LFIFEADAEGLGTTICVFFVTLLPAANQGREREREDRGERERERKKGEMRRREKKKEKDREIVNQCLRG
jgi:hypothetical protein